MWLGGDTVLHCPEEDKAGWFHKLLQRGCEMKAMPFCDSTYSHHLYVSAMCDAHHEVQFVVH
jgi:hypothetical protein